MVDLIQTALLWGLILNYGLLLWWFGWFTLAHDRVFKLHSHWFKISPEHFDAIHYAAMAFFKLAVFMFNLVPYLALLLARQ